MSRFQYYFDCDYIFNLFYNIKIYNYEISYSYFQQLSDQSLLFSVLLKALSIKFDLLKVFFMICIILFIMSWSQKFSYYFFYIACLEICYNFWNLFSMWLFLLINMMNLTNNSSSSMFIINLNACMNSTDNNSCDYFSFNMNLVLSYMNNLLIYYFIFSIIFTAE